MIVNLTPQRQSFIFAAGAAAGHAPAAATTYNFGSEPGKNPGTGDSVFSVLMPRAGNVRRIYGIFVVAGTLASAGSITVRAKNNTGPATETITAALVGTAVANTFSNTAMTLAFVAGDGLQIQFACPVWVTAPTLTFWTVTMEVEFT